MRAVKLIAVLLVIVGLAGCSSKFKTYNGPEVTRVIVSKENRQMYLMHHDKVLRNYPVELGFAPVGHKQFEGDGKTPEGHYYIDRHNPKSAFHLSVGISYPNVDDRAYAHSKGKSPGGDIFFHGRPNNDPRKNDRDWTAGCIAMKNKHIEWVYAMVKTRTPVTILP